jgi:hypothetical protein
MSGKSKKLYSSASNDYILGLVNLILSNGDISEEVLKRIGRVLGARWRREYVAYERRKEEFS